LPPWKYPNEKEIQSETVQLELVFDFLNLAQRRSCAVAILALLFADIVRFGGATLASPLTFAHRAL
jgi:hypothetical protein